MKRTSYRPLYGGLVVSLWSFFIKVALPESTATTLSVGNPGRQS
jgi:hypothetical protein